MSGTESTKVLVIDDDDMVLIILRKLLEAEMFTVDVALSAREALGRLSDTRYDAILCDMWMPGMTGKEFYYQVRRDYPEYQHRIILLTGDIASEVTWDFIEQRRLPYVLKPVSPHELRRKLEEVIGERADSAAAQKGAENRRHRRVAVKGSVRVRKKKWAVGGPEITTVGNISKDGIYFLTERVYRAGTELMVAFPYTGANDVEQEGYVVRVDERTEGRRGVAVALGLAAEAARAAMVGSSEEDRQRQRILALAEMTSEAPRGGSATAMESPSNVADLKLQLARERQEGRRASEELADLKTVYQRAASERDRLAAEETEFKQQIRELTSVKEAMAEQFEQLNRQLETLQKRLAAAEAERDHAARELQAAREQSQTRSAAAGASQEAVAAPQGQKSEAEVARLREEIKELQARVQEFQAVGVGPLTILAAYCDMLQMNKALDDNTKKTLTEVTQQANLLRSAFQKLTKKT